MKSVETSLPYQTPKNTNTDQGNSNSLTNLKYDLQYFVNLDSENKICFDCGGPFPTYVSINHGAFICSNCAKNHSRLGYNISFIHQINSPWDPYLLSYAQRGGNSRFKRLCNQYEVPCESFNENNDQKLNKYLIRLGEYHRLLLRSEILADEPPKPLYLEVAKNKCDLNIIYFPEFENYRLYKGEIVVPGKKYNIGGKIWNGTKTTAGIVGTAGGMVYKVGKPVVCFLGKSAFNGLKFIGKSIYNHYHQENGKSNNNIMNGDKIMNDNDNNNGSNNFALVDYADEDMKEIRTLNINSFTDNGNNININNNMNYNNNNIQNNFSINSNNGMNNNYSNGINSNKFNTYTINDNQGNNNIINNNNIVINNQYENINNHNNIISNDNYLINYNEQNNYNLYNKKQSNDSLKNATNLNNNNNNNNFSMDGFEILSNNNPEKENSNSSNSLFDNNLYAGMNVEFENTDQIKARQDANNFLLKP